MLLGHYRLAPLVADLASYPATAPREDLPICALLVPPATARPVCEALAPAMCRHGMLENAAP